MSLVTTIEALLDRAIRRRTFADPLAAAFSFSSYADAEDGGENQVFERALLRVKDPRFSRLVRRHQDDEIRHAAMFRARRDALGLASIPVPGHLRLVDRLSEEAGGILDLPMDKDEDVMRVYALLFVIEERALHEFGGATDALEFRGDKESVEVFRSIAADEAKHLQYCLAVGTRYAASEEVFVAEVERLREIESRVYGEVGRAYAWWLLKHQALGVPKGLGWLLGAILGMAEAAARPAPRLSGPVAKHTLQAEQAAA